MGCQSLGGRALRYAYWVVLLVLGTLTLSGLCAQSALADLDGYQISIHDGAGTEPVDVVSDAQMTSVADVHTQRTTFYDGYFDAPGPEVVTVAGASARMLAEVAGVVPSTLTSMVVTGDGTGTFTGETADTLSEAEVVLGFDSTAADDYLAPGDTPFQQAVFASYGNFMTYAAPQRGATDDNGSTNGAVGWTISAFAMPMSVVLNVKGTVLGVPTPTVTPTSPAPGATATFSVNAGDVTLGLTGSADPNLLESYTWDFGDGATQTTSTPYARYAFPASTPTGSTFDVRVTVTDAAGNKGVSGNALVVQVGRSTDSPGPPNGNGSGNGGGGGSRTGGGGTAPTGGGTGPDKNALPNGPTTGSLKAPTTTLGSGKGGGGGGSGSHGGKGGGTGSGGTGGGGSGAGGSGSGNGKGTASGSATSGAGKANGGAGKQPRRPSALGALAAEHLTGVLIESSGAPLTGGSASALSSLQSIAQRSVRLGGSGGLPAWLLGILAALLLLASGVIREAGPRILRISKTSLLGRWRTIPS